MIPERPASFDLVDRPWVLVRRVDGRVNELSLVEVFRQAGKLTGLVGEVPTQVYALTRLLLAVLYRAVDGPRDLDHWEQLWQADELPADAVEKYLDEHRDRFDLLHSRTPFLQVADLHTAKGEMLELGRLIADVPPGRPFFSTRLGPEQPMPFAEAARWLVHCHAFDPSGIKSGAVGDPRVKGGKGYPIGTGWSGYLGGVLAEGATLRETLLLNLIAIDHAELAKWADSDAPAWERAPVGAGPEEPDGRAPVGPVDLYTWQSRRVRLAHDGRQVTGVLICNGERITPQNKHRVEPLTAWRRSTAQEKKHRLPTVYMPKEHDPERAIWRGLQSLLPGAVSAGQRGEAASTLSPIVLGWLARVSDEVLGPDHPIHLRTIGMVYGSQSSTTADIIDDGLDLHSVLLQHSVSQKDVAALVGVAVAGVTAAEDAARALGALAANLAEAAGGEPDGHRSRATELAYAELDPLYRSWVGRLRADTNSTDAQEQWHRQIKQVIVGLGDELLRHVPEAAWTGRVVRKHRLTAAHADISFRRALRKTIPMAYGTSDPQLAGEPA